MTDGVLERFVRYKHHDIHIQRDEKMFGWWYIIVTAPCGSKVYDGWWRDSACRTADEAIAEAKRGAMLAPTAECLACEHQKVTKEHP